MSQKMMTYKDMVERAKDAGVTTEKMMWESIYGFSELLEAMREAHPEKYWDFMRRQHGIMYNGHYDQTFAEYDVSQLSYTSHSGEKRKGPHWTVDQIVTATAGLKFPQGTTEWDKYVAFNSAYADLSQVLDDSDVIKAGYALYFADEDWGSPTKIWDMYLAKPRKR